MKKSLMMMFFGMMLSLFLVSSISALAYTWESSTGYNCHDHLGIYSSYNSHYDKTLVCMANMSDNIGQLCNCNGGSLNPGQTYYIEFCFDETSGDKGYFGEGKGSFKLMGFKSSSSWGGSKPTAYNMLLQQDWDFGGDDTSDNIGVDYWKGVFSSSSLVYSVVDADSNTIRINLEDDKITGNQLVVMKVKLGTDAKSSNNTYLLAQDALGNTKQSCKLGIQVTPLARTTKTARANTLFGLILSYINK